MSESSEQTVIHVDLRPRGYDIRVGDNELPQIAATIEPWMSEQFGAGPHNAVIITDHNVAPHADVVRRSLADADWIPEVIAIEPGERSKRLEVLSDLYDRMVALEADRQTLVLAVGGGVVGDTAGFLAASYARGVPFVQVPTSLLADVDSSVGGKVGINHPQAKNLIGAFYQPLGVVIDTQALATLPDREYRSGLAEVVKYGVILDAEFFEFLETNIDGLNARNNAVLRHAIASSCRLKADVVEQDEFERTGLRAVLNYGHTFAHAYEALCGYRELLHGEAVSIGMVHASQLAQRLGRIEAEDTRRQIALLEALHLPTQLPSAEGLSVDAVLSRMHLDKKTVAGRLRFVLPTRLGHVELVSDVPENDVRAILNDAL